MMETSIENQCVLSINENIPVKSDIKEPKTENNDEKLSQKENIEEILQNSGIKRIKEDQNLDVKRRRSLRTEVAATIKKKPPKYEEIFGCYKRKEYKECIIYIDLVAETAKDWIEYQILKAACLIHLGIKLIEAHKILDDVLKVNNQNVFIFYAKGLAYYHEEKWSESLQFLEKAVNLGKNSMERAEVLLKSVREEIGKFNKENEAIGDDIKSELIEEDDDLSTSSHQETTIIADDENFTPRISSSKNKDRFKCEICDKNFCKKFNLDRHNRIMHNRETPYIPPLPRNYNNSSSRKSEPVQTKVEEEEKLSSPDSSPVAVSKKSQLKIRLGKKIKKSHSFSTLTSNNEMGRCKICKKLYRKGSLARHEVIHTGNKQFRCEDCPMAFYQKSDLQRHITIHSDIFDYECELCEKKFRIKKNLQVHNKRHHSK